MMTKKQQAKLEKDVLDDFMGGLNMFRIGFAYDRDVTDIEAILRKALKAQDKKKGKA